nr:cyrochrome p450 monooxygenase [Quercus suber]
MSQYFVHLNPEIFPSPHTYDPTRWLAAKAESTLERYLVPFSRGARMCIGMNVAHAELYTLLVTMLRRFPTLTLFETSERDVELVHDYFAGVSRHEREGLQVEVKRAGGL